MGDLAIVQTVWFPRGEIGESRIAAARESLDTWTERIYGYQSDHVHIADDGSDPSLLDEYRSGYLAATLTSAPRYGCAGSLRLGVQYIMRERITDVIAYLQDDWSLDEDLDLAPSLALIRSGYADVVRLGPTHPNLRGKVVRTPIPDAEWCLEYDWDAGGYVVGWRPSLYRASLLAESLEGIPDGLSAIEGERLWLERMAAMRPRVFHAPNCTLAGPFRHIETVELGEDAPTDLDARYRNA